MLTTKVIESRVARIKARVAELTGKTQPEATTLKHAKYEDRSPSRGPRGQSDNRRGSEQHHYGDSDNERVARIKARVVELTGKMQTEATTLNDAQYEDRSPSRSPRGQSDSGRGSQRHHYYDSENEHHEAAYSPHQGRRLSKTRGSRSPSPDYDSEFERKVKRLQELEAKEREDQAREKYEEERLVKEAKKAKEKAKREKEGKELTEKEIEDYNRKQKEEKEKKEKEKKEKEKKEKEKKEADEELRERVKKTFGQAGYDEESIDKILKNAEKGKAHGHGKEIKISDLRRPTYIRVHREHISLETLDEYNLPWDWDEVNRFLRCRLSKCLVR